MSDNMILTLLGLGTAAVLFGLILYILSVIGGWKIFTKAGEAGWKSLIPVYNSYISFKIAGLPKLFFVSLAITVVNFFIPGGNDASVLMSLVSTVLSLAALVVIFMKNKNLAKAFGYGTGFAIGLTICPFIFNLILGFGSSKYTSPEN